MTKTGFYRLCRLVLCAGMAFVPCLAGAVGEARTLVVHFYDYAHVPDAEWRLAKQRTDQVYGKIGVNLFWVQGRAAFETPANALHVYVVIMSQAQAALQTGIHAQEFGIADKHAATAYIYYSRIVDHAGQSWISTGSALGRIIAHEIGHLLLPDGHSKSGIMRDYLNIEPNGLELFEDAQAAAIRAKIDSVGR